MAGIFDAIAVVTPSGGCGCAQPRRKPIGQSIFGGSVFTADALPEKVEPPWGPPTEPSADQPAPVLPRGMSGFGGFGFGAYDATPDKLAVGTGPGGSFQGNQGCRMPGPSGTSTWPAAWACNVANFKAMLKVADSYRPTSQKLDDPRGWYPKEYIDAVLAGKLPPPEGFPTVAVQREFTNTGIVPPGIVPPPAPPPPQMLASSSGAGPGIAIGVGALALIGGAILIMKKRKSASASA